MARNVSIIGGGAWGTAIAKSLADCGQNVLIWAHEKDVVSAINRNHENKTFLPGVKLPENLKATHALDDLPAHADVIFSVCPATFTTQIAASLNPLMSADHTVVVCSKGFRESDGALLTDVWTETVASLKNIAVFTGPSFAAEVAANKPTCLLLASRRQEAIDKVNSLFCKPTMRLYFSDDMIGAQIGGAVKNVVAIAAGIADGLGLGHNVRAALISRGIAEMARYGVALGGKAETLSGMAGLGDVVLTATSEQSRNFRFGQRVGRGVPVADALNMDGKVVEGVKAARIVTVQAAGRGIDLPIIMGTDGVLSGDIAPQEAINLLLNRPRVKEFEE
ncbi:MAG: NAD(P)H-dependent glycerol-3-phosphate dehydrogenase [Proteobacteria bacterium]|nr:NAD(P)H-dependent glycerol-3-phosphate dehydrogenase [Pseudomonadota bacterium]